MSDATNESEPSSDSSTSTIDSQKATDLLAPDRITGIGLLLEGVCLLVALAVGYLGWHDPRQPIGSLIFVDWKAALGWTAIGLLGSATLATAILLAPLKPFREFRAFTLETLAPLFRPLSVFQIAIISASAGIGEEMLFRWCIQGGIEGCLSTSYKTLIALAIASLLFGLCHALNILYAVFATLMGVLMGSLMIASGSVVPAILAHALYDLGAILVLRRIGRRMADRDRAMDRASE